MFLQCSPLLPSNWNILGASQPTKNDVKQVGRCGEGSCDHECVQKKKRKEMLSRSPTTHEAAQTAGGHLPRGWRPVLWNWTWPQRTKQEMRAWKWIIQTDFHPFIFYYVHIWISRWTPAFPHVGSPVWTQHCADPGQARSSWSSAESKTRASETVA